MAYFNEEFLYKTPAYKSLCDVVGMRSAGVLYIDRIPCIRILAGSLLKRRLFVAQLIS